MRRLSVRRLTALAIILAINLFSGPTSAQQGIEPDDVQLKLKLEPRAHPPHPGEMILLSIEGTYKIPVVREKLRQPALDGFDWMQLGEDRWFKAFEDGPPKSRARCRDSPRYNRAGTSR